MSLLYFYPCPKQPSYSRAVNSIRYAGEREVCETKEAWEKRREELFLLKAGRCEMCRRFAPLHDRTNDYGEVVTLAGHADHIVERGMGGSRRDDRLPNLRWLCAWCHQRRHTPAKVVPKKVLA